MQSAFKEGLKGGLPIGNRLFSRVVYFRLFGSGRRA